MEDDEIENYTKFKELFVAVLENVKDMIDKMLPTYQQYLSDLNAEPIYVISETPDTSAVKEFQGINLNK